MLSFHIVAPVGSLRPNAFGLFDVHGNVDEWCGDPGPSAEKATGDRTPLRPVDGLPGIPDERQRVLRGGDYVSQGGSVRSAFRRGFFHDSRRYDWGVRPMRAIER